MTRGRETVRRRTEAPEAALVAWLDQQLHELEHGAPDTVLAALQGLPAVTLAGRDEPHCPRDEAVSYLTKRRARRGTAQQTIPPAPPPAPAGAPVARQRRRVARLAPGHQRNGRPTADHPGRKPFLRRCSAEPTPAARS